MVSVGVAGASALRQGGRGAAAGGSSIMLRPFLVQQWFNLPDPRVEGAMHESARLRGFVGVDLGMAPAPDGTTVLRFHHLLEKHDLSRLMLEAVNVHLEVRGSNAKVSRSYCLTGKAGALPF